MADPVPANKWSLATAALTSLAPSLNTIFIALVGIAMGVSGFAGWQAVRPTEVAKSGLVAADVPKQQGQLPSPIACAETFHELETKGDLLLKASGQLQTSINEVLSRLPPPVIQIPRRSPSKLKAAGVP